MPRKPSATGKDARINKSRATSKTEETEDSGCNARRNSLRQSVRSPQSADEAVLENTEETRMSYENTDDTGNYSETIVETTSKSRRKPAASTPKNLSVKRSISKSSLQVNTSIASSPLSMKSPKGKEGKLLSLREENNKLDGDITVLKKEIDLWNRRLTRGSRFAKFKKEMKPLDDRVKELEQERKQLDEMIEEDKNQSERAEMYIEKTINNIKTVLVAAKISFTEGKLSTGKNAAVFLKNLSSKEKASLMETLKQRKFALDG